MVPRKSHQCEHLNLAAGLVISLKSLLKVKWVLVAIASVCGPDMRRLWLKVPCFLLSLDVLQRQTNPAAARHGRLLQLFAADRAPEVTCWRLLKLDDASGLSPVPKVLLLHCISKRREEEKRGHTRLCWSIPAAQLSHCWLCYTGTFNSVWFPEPLLHSYAHILSDSFICLISKFFPPFREHQKCLSSSSMLM